MTQDWDIKSRSTACTACSVSFNDGQTYLSALFTGDTGYERGDFCEECWKSRAGELDPFSSWQGVYRRPPSGPEDPLKKETAESLLRKLIEDDDPRNEAVIYILAVMLERKKSLVEKDVTVDDLGTVHRVYEHRHTGETFLILDPQLKLDQLEGVQTRVIEMLGGQAPHTGTDTPAEPPPASQPYLPDLSDPTDPTDPPDPTDPSDQTDPSDLSDSSDESDEDDDSDEFDDEDEDDDDEDEEDDDDDDS
jgi:hypothetical protein